MLANTTFVKLTFEAITIHSILLCGYYSVCDYYWLVRSFIHLEICEFSVCVCVVYLFAENNKNSCLQVMNGDQCEISTCDKLVLGNSFFSHVLLVS